MRNFISTWSAPIWIFASLLQPFFWVFVFGQLFKPVPINFEGQNLEYLSFFGPGMLAATTVFAALWSGIGFSMDRKSGVLKRMRLSPASDLSILFAYVCQSLTGVLFQSAIVLILISFLGANLDWTIITMVKVFLCVWLLAFTVSSLSHLLSLLITDELALVHLNSFIALPLLFFSSALFPIDQSPGWLQFIANFNPLHHSAELMRSLLIPEYSLSNQYFYWSILGGIGLLLFSRMLMVFRHQKLA